MFHHFRHHRQERDLSHPRGGRFGRFLEERASHGPRGRHGGGRVFDQGDLRWVILKLISEKPSHGYELIKAIEERLGGAYSPSPGVIYPTLTLLEDLGYVAEVRSEGAKKAYGVTPDGEAALAQNAGIVETIFKRIDDIAAKAGGGPAPQIIRGIENLRLALRLRLEAGRMNDEQVTRIADALDAAARAVEQA